MSLTPREVLSRTLDLVSAPTIYTQLNALLSNPYCTMEQISQVITQDPALTTRLLKIVNSPYYDFPSEINTLSRAITIVGTRELTYLVMATSVINAFNGIPRDLIDMHTFWRHSIATAMTSRQLATLLEQSDTEQYFVAGLLHNIGSLVLYQSLPEFAREAINSAKHGHEPLHLAEQRLLGFDHAEVGAVLAETWRLPELLVQVARYHHQPSNAPGTPVAVDVVHIADIIVSAVPFGHTGAQHVPPLDSAAWQRLNLTTTVIPEIVEQVTRQLNELVVSMCNKN